MLPTCSLNLMRTRQCCRKSLFSEKVIGWSWQKSQGILYEKLQHFLNKECPYCPVQCTDFFTIFSFSSFISNESRKKRERADDKKKNMEGENRKGKQHRIPKNLWKSFSKHAEKSKKYKHFQIWENIILNQRWKRKSTPFQALKMSVLTINVRYHWGELFMWPVFLFSH